ncbi:hypothetical protein DPEC_G00344780 [Dallia pectoralis]|uniref:Uncharacterized protein n=1 Tax=Dallia pectoralis TaxID=75939 RepID=A0ACC2F372_DALPE|nr:hypothetical protein DPEC_G00344780 [Dallia pectoralis]
MLAGTLPLLNVKIGHSAPYLPGAPPAHQLGHCVGRGNSAHLNEAPAHPCCSGPFCVQPGTTSPGRPPSLTWSWDVLLSNPLPPARPRPPLLLPPGGAAEVAGRAGDSVCVRVEGGRGSFPFTDCQSIKTQPTAVRAAQKRTRPGNGAPSPRPSLIPHAELSMTFQALAPPQLPVLST